MNVLLPLQQRFLHCQCSSVNKKKSYNNHLTVCPEFVGDMIGRTYETIQIVEAALLSTTRLDQGAGLDTPTNTQPPEKESVCTNHPAGTQPKNKPEDRDSAHTDHRSKREVNNIYCA